MSSAYLNTPIGRIDSGDKIKVVVDAYKPKTIITVNLIIHEGGYYFNTKSFNNGVFPGVPKVNGYNALYKFSPGQSGIKFKEIIERGTGTPLTIEKLSFKAPEPMVFKVHDSISYTRPPAPEVSITSLIRKRRILKLNQDL